MLLRTKEFELSLRDLDIFEIRDLFISVSPLTDIPTLPLKNDLKKEINRIVFDRIVKQELAGTDLVKECVRSIYEFCKTKKYIKDCGYYVLEEDALDYVPVFIAYLKYEKNELPIEEWSTVNVPDGIYKYAGECTNK